MNNLKQQPNTSTIKEATKALNHAIYSGDVEGIATYQQEYEAYKESMRFGNPLPDKLPVLPEALAQEIGPEHTNMYNTLSNAPPELKDTLQPYFNAGFSVNHAVEQATPYALGGTLVGGGAGLLIDHQGRVNNASLAALR